jgi:hypothetical protein
MLVTGAVRAPIYDALIDQRGVADIRWVTEGAKIAQAELEMMKILNRILWFVQLLGAAVPPMDIPGYRKGSRGHRP